MHTLIVRLMIASSALALPSSAVAQQAHTAAIGHPTGPNAVVVRVTSSGGFVAPSAILGRLPAFTLYGDGTVIVPGPIKQISPGPAISPLLQSHLSEQQVQALLRSAGRAGLLARGTIPYGDMGSIGVSDMPTTTVALHVAGRKVVRQAYALGVAGRRVPPAQAKARRALARFVADLPRGLGGARYVPRRLAIFVSPFSGPGQPGASPITWPLASDIATAGTRAGGSGARCITVRGAGARTLLARLQTATDQSRWVARGKPAAFFALIARPLLRDEQACASVT